MVAVYPQQELAVYCVMCVDESIVITAVFRLIEYGKRTKSVRYFAGLRPGLRRIGAKQSDPLSIIPFPFLSSANQALW